uniref:C2H2-type domain-containing protein n=1 Tax=Acrobeloides nanus TaxID=290746 RepID=A0A914ELY3_9BILA
MATTPDLRKYRQAFIEAYNIRFSDVDPPLRQIAAENLFNSITSEDQLKSTMADLLRYSKKFTDASTSKYGDSSQETLSFSDSPNMKIFQQNLERSRERPAQEKLQKEIQSFESRIVEFQSIMKTRDLTSVEVFQLQEATQQRDELQKKLKKTMDAAIRAKRYRIRKAAHHGGGGGGESDVDSFPEVKRPSYNSQGMVARVSYSDRIVEGSLVEGRGVSSVASAESDCYSVDGTQDFDTQHESTRHNNFIDTRSTFGSISDKNGYNNNDTPSEFNLENTQSKTSSKNVDQYICNQCEMAFDSFNNFISHMRSAHLKSNDPDLRCRICQASFTNSQSRLAHLLEHFVGTNSSYSCHQCPNKQFENGQQFRQHFVSFHTDVLYRCAVCLRIFSQNNAYQEHIMAHAIDNMHFQCVVCNLAFETHELLMAHVQLVHDRDESAILPSNRRKPSAMITPINGHTGVKVEGTGTKNYGTGSNSMPQKGLKCFVCDLECPDENSLDEHRLFNHCKIPKGDRCAVCHMTLHSYDDFVHHTQMHATGLSEMSCVICRQTIRGEAQLKMHGEYHLNNDDLPTKCAYCDKVG